MHANSISFTAAVLLLSVHVAGLLAARFPGCRRRSGGPDFTTRMLTCRLTPGDGALIPPDDK